MKKINPPNDLTDNSIRRCAICGCNTGDAYLKTPYGTYVCPDCSATIYEIVSHALEQYSDNDVYFQEDSSTDGYEDNPISPIFIDQETFF